MPNAHALSARRLIYAAALVLVSVIATSLIIVLGIHVIFGVHDCDLIRTEEVEAFRTEPRARYDGTNATELVPRLMHWNWKEDVLPERWQPVVEKCRAMHPSYTYRLWTDVTSREFIADRYPWFLETYDSYEWTIERADAFRYFVLYEFGGVYLDLDVGCEKPVDPLLNFEVVLPHTKPIGISNDFMVAAPRHPFFRMVIDSLETYNRWYVVKYATVMFSTGPMFLSAMYGSIAGESTGVRVLPRRMYGKHVHSGEAFFTHYFASSWHGNDAAPIEFIGRNGIYFVYVVALLAAYAVARRVYRLRKRGEEEPDCLDEFEKNPLLFTRASTPSDSRSNADSSVSDAHRSSADDASTVSPCTSPSPPALWARRPSLHLTTLPILHLPTQKQD